MKKFVYLREDFFEAKEIKALQKQDERFVFVYVRLLVETDGHKWIKPRKIDQIAFERED